MSTTNQEIAHILNVIAELYKVEKSKPGASSNLQYKSKSYITASNNIREYPIPITSEAEALKVKGVGKSIAKDIGEYLSTKTIIRLEELKANNIDKYNELTLSDVPDDSQDVIDLFLSIPYVGPKRAYNYYNSGFRTIEDLWTKGQQYLTDQIKTSIIWLNHTNLRINRNEISLIEQKIRELLPGIKFDIAGSYRRCELDSGDVDVLVEYQPGLDMEEIYNKLKPILPATLNHGQTKFAGIVRLSQLYNGHHIDIMLQEPETYHAALLYFTGSKEFNVLIRSRAIEFGYSLNEYGLKQGDKIIPTSSEQEIFDILKVRYVAPIDRVRNIQSIPTY